MVEVGTLYLGTNVPGTEGWTLAEPLQSGDYRSYRSRDIKFTKPFTRNPRIVVSIAGFETSNYHDGRMFIKVLPEDIQPDEFTISVVTRGYLEISELAITWIATDGA